MVDERLIARVAELYYMHNISQYELAKKFNFSKAKVCRIIKDAKKKKIIQFSIKNFDTRTIDLEKRLEEKFKLREVIIYSNSDGKEYDENLVFQEIGLLGAQFIERILKDNLNIALAWGKTIYYVIKNIKIDKKYDVNIFSTLGGVSITKTEYQNNNLVQMLSEKIGGISYPVYLPLMLEKAEHKKLLSGNHDIKKILGNTSKIEYYFAGVGNITENSRMYTLGGFNLNFLHELRDKNVCGEIGLNFYDINGNFINVGIEDRIFNLDIEEIKKIKNTVIIAFGKLKIDPILGFLRTGIANILITDSITAQLLMEK